MLIGGLNKITTRPNACKPTVLTPKDAMSMMGLLSSTQYATGAGVLGQVDNWTLEAIINPSTLPQGPGSILSCGNGGAGFAMNVAGGGDSAGSKFTNLLHSKVWIDTGYTFASTGVEYRLAFVRRSGRTYAYVNGTELAGGQVTTAPYTPANYTTVGSERQSGGGMVRQLLGQVRELRVWNVARSAVEIAAVDDQKLTGKETGLVGYWPGYVRGGKLIAVAGPDLDLVGLSSPPLNAGNVIGKSITAKKGVWSIGDVHTARNGIRRTATLVDSFDSSAWTACYGNGGISTSQKIEGTGSRWASKTNTSSDYCGMYRIVAWDLGAAVEIGIWVFVADQSILDAMHDDCILLRFGSNNSNYRTLKIQKTQLVLNEWTLIRKPVSGAETTGSPPAWTNITYADFVAYRGTPNSFVFGSEQLFLDFLHYTV